MNCGCAVLTDHAADVLGEFGRRRGSAAAVPLIGGAVERHAAAARRPLVALLRLLQVVGFELAPLGVADRRRR